MSSRTGCEAALSISWPWPGSRSLGSEMTTPGIGPATDGLRGLALLTVSHAGQENRRPRGW